MRYLSFIIVLLFAGCAEKKTYNFLHEEVTFKVKIVDELPKEYLEKVHKGKTRYTVHAMTACKDDSFKDCTILIPKSSYPYCLTHEIRHVLEGDWHDRDVLNKQDCKNP